ncbi:hypothetical protein FRUB_06695 [Fimbriiglobus ruber]|uniref:Uncharacterized protein n=1 Tax=Fimbriiglobus ruber TaxID=1908690 RepID=A0A225DMC4_9BACT|nr:hypothetical protein FRUB_06695 [Fimbriiglobus ruber]
MLTGNGPDGSEATASIELSLPLSTICEPPQKSPATEL